VKAPCSPGASLDIFFVSTKMKVFSCATCCFHSRLLFIIQMMAGARFPELMQKDINDCPIKNNKKIKA